MGRRGEHTVYRAGYSGADTITRQEIPQMLRYDQQGAAEGGTPPLGSHSHMRFESFTVVGTLGVVSYPQRWYAPKPLTVEGVRLGVGTAPTGAALIVDVNKNVTSIFAAANRPQISAGAFTGYSALPLAAGKVMAVGDYLQIDVDQVGSSVAGSDLVVVVYFL